MAIVQISKIQHRTGANIDLPQLDIGEVGFATDTKQLFIGNDPLIDPPQGLEPTVTEIFTNSANCKIDVSHLTGIINIPVANIKIQGGTNGYVLQTDGTGNLSWTSQSGGGGGGGGTVSGSNTQIQFNNAGSFGSDSGLTYDYTTQNLTVAGNISTSKLISTGNIIATNANLGNLVSANYFAGSGNNLSNIQGSNVSGHVANATVAGVVYTNAQPNITSVGTLSGLTVSNSSGTVDFTSVGNINLGSIGNINIGGGSSGYVMSTDGNGNLSWVEQSTSSGGSATPAGLNSQIQFNSNEVFGSDSDFTYDTNSKTLHVPNASITGNVTAGHFVGDGSYLTNITIPGANVTSAVAYATTANAVAWGNVTQRPSRVTQTATTSSIPAGNYANITINGFKGYALYSIHVNAAAWVTVYSSISARSNDITSGRTSSADPTPGSGVLCEVITTGDSIQTFTPAIIGFSGESSPSTDIQLKVTNEDISSAAISVTLTLLQLEY
jgi:hypothetical protein